jgi:hypothetical protein
MAYDLKKVEKTGFLKYGILRACDLLLGAGKFEKKYLAFLT